MTVAAVVIGRNEGARLARCLASLQGKASPIVYVDSGSTDNSIEIARATGAEIVDLDMSVPFTAARARNTGLARFKGDLPKYVQVVDGDCEIQNGWIDIAAAFLETHPDVAIVAGRLRERHPEATIWNRLADDEWDEPYGETEAVAGTALLRRTAIAEVGGYLDRLIAGEEPEMCLRLRQSNWKIWRLSDEMALHDIEMTRFGQWWKRMSRGGHAFAEVAAMHWGEPERFRVIEACRALVWGFGVPIAALLGAFLVSPWFLLLLLAWPLQVARLILLRGMPAYQAFFLTLGKLPEAQGVLTYIKGRFLGRRHGLIEYKAPPRP